jgi:hypothetical protein
MSGGFREHQVQLYLDKDLYRAFIKLQGDKDLGRSYAGLLPYVEGLYRMGYITKDVYDLHFKKYSEPLGEKASVLSPERKKQQDNLESKDRQFKMMLEQWDQHASPEWRMRVFADAEKWKDKIESARLLLLKAVE